MGANGFCIVVPASRARCAGCNKPAIARSPATVTSTGEVGEGMPICRDCIAFFSAMDGSARVFYARELSLLSSDETVETEGPEETEVAA